MSNPQSADVVVIGGGIRGCTIALFLAREGLRVTLVERRFLSFMTSSANGGQVNVTDKSPDYYTALSLASARMYPEFVAGLDGEVFLQQKGILHVAMNEEQMDRIRRRVQTLQQVPGLRVQLVDDREAKEIVPGLTPDPFPTYGTGVEIRLSMPGPKEKLLTEAMALFGSEEAYLPGNYSLAKVRMVIEAEHRSRIPDILGVCIYVIDGYNKSSTDYHFFYDRLVDLYQAVTGRSLTRQSLFAAAERLVNLERCLDAREGLNRDEDRLPKRFFHSFPGGANKDKALDMGKMEEMKTAYYRERGWDVETGLPTPEKLRVLGLADFIPLG